MVTNIRKLVSEGLVFALILAATVATNADLPSLSQIKDATQTSYQVIQKKGGASTYYHWTLLHRNALICAKKMGFDSWTQEIESVHFGYKTEPDDYPKFHDGDNGGLPVVWFELFRNTGDSSWYDLGMIGAHGKAAAKCKTFDQGDTDCSVFGNFDAISIAGTVLTAAFELSGDFRYMQVMLSSIDKSLKTYWMPEKGLFRHRRDNDETPWNRGNGWAMAGLTEALLLLPKDHSKYDSLMGIYLTFCDSLLSYQQPSGLWRNVITFEESPDEVSGTNLFMFGMAQGLLNGWFEDPTPYKAAVEKAWQAVMALQNEDGKFESVCNGTGSQPTPEDYDNVGLSKNIHGPLTFLWAAYALYDYVDSEISTNIKPFTAHRDRLDLRLPKAAPDFFTVNGRKVSGYGRIIDRRRSLAPMLLLGETGIERTVIPRD